MRIDLERKGIVHDLPLSKDGLSTNCAFNEKKT
jgi:hypothetical protein